MPLTAVMIDSREPAHIAALRFGGTPTVVTTLDCGDLWASTDDGALLLVERKTPSDLLSSIKDGRLMQQVSAMRARSPWIYLVVTGALAHTLDGHVIADERTTGWRWDDVQGALVTAQELGAAVLVCRGDGQYEEAVLRLARREREPQKALAPRTQGHILTPAEQLLMALPGIGPERAQKMLTHFEGQAGRALAWLTWLDTVAELEGIRNGTKHGVRRALGLADDEWLTVFNAEAARYAAKIAQGEAADERGEPALEPLVGVWAQGAAP